jgi:hypothetical protein
MINSVWIHFHPIKVPADAPLPSATRVNRAHFFCFLPLHARRKVVAKGNVTFTGKSAAKIFLDGSFAGNIPATIPLSAGRHKILVSAGKSADRQEYLRVMAGGSQTYDAAFPTASKKCRVRSPRRQSYRPCAPG